MKMKRLMMLVCVAALTACVFCVPTYAASGDVAGAIEGTWDTASEQIKTVVNNVVFPAVPSHRASQRVSLQTAGGLSPGGFRTGHSQ